MHDQVPVCELNGQLERETIGSLISQVKSLEMQGPVVLNLAFVHYIDTTAIAVLVDLKQRFDSLKRPLYLLAVGKGVMQIFELAGLKKYFQFATSLDEILKNGR